MANVGLNHHRTPHRLRFILGQCGAAGPADHGQQQLGRDWFDPVASVLRVAPDLACPRFGAAACILRQAR
jgi:hypothetical protein